ncbi:sugar transferase [Fulvivirga ligni]|uniref:sugar transferase n=1 Tax=Fulvivirga ligni TaxID=2904246 RepID=UPI001F32BD78|nr:sugar transferase [Fulvivirga ligni]UII19707.1 sugar transferase [Fulvivirga ligni]
MKDEYLTKLEMTSAQDQATEPEANKAYLLFIGACDNLCLDLRLEGYTVKNLECPFDAYNWIKSVDAKELPDVIIVNSDIYIDSLQPYQDIKNGILKDVPMIFLADEFNEEERDLAIKIGAEDYYTDSISARDLSQRIDFLARLKELSQNHGHVVEVGVKPDSSLYNSNSFKIWTMKRAFDVLVSSTILLFISPILLLIAIAVKLDSKGPIFYISKRAGKGYQIFDFYKFRSMRQDADKEVQSMQHLNQYNIEENAVFFKVKDDPRITKLGNFLRTTSLDELPQLFNVLKGDMSLVGNRPLPLYEAEKLTQDQWALRFLAPAGITGLWQITKRGKDDMSVEERVALDIEYAETNSFWTDMKILFSTFPAVIQKNKV